jgi:ethanolamine utilization cobalamin adenosyltransferase
MTHLNAEVLVPKTHPRIFLRGKIDCLMAQLIGVQLVAREEGKDKLVDELEDLLCNLRLILAAEVKDAPLESRRMLGMDSDEIRRVSHNVKEHIGIDHPIPNCRMGRASIALNRLRTQVREVELAAAHAFAGERGVCSREDILRALNRLSSCVYILFCRDVAGRYNGRA